MSYQLQSNEIELDLPTPTLSSETSISCILSRPNGTTSTRRGAILMHGIGGQKNYCYHSKLANKLSNEFGMYVMRFDFRNCGKSSKTFEKGRTLQDDIEDITTVYNYLTKNGIFVDTLVGHSRGVVDMFNWQLQNENIFVMNLVACAGRFDGSGLLKSIESSHPDVFQKNGHFIKGFQDGEYVDVWVPLEETKSLSELYMTTVKDISSDTDTLCIYGTEEQVIPMIDAYQYSRWLGDRNQLVLIDGANHGFKGVVKIPQNEWGNGNFEIDKRLSVANYNKNVSDTISNWMSSYSMCKRFHEKHYKIHPFLNRWKQIEGFVNFRDIGGYFIDKANYIKYGRVFRSAHMADISESDIISLKELGITKIFDLRSPFEREQIHVDLKGIEIVNLMKDCQKDKSEVLRIVLDMPTNPLAMKESYKYLLDFFMMKCKPIFEHLKNPDFQPFLFYCTHGKDRTGMVTMLILLLCDLDPLMIQQEYGLSLFGLEGFSQLMREKLLALQKDTRLADIINASTEIPQGWSYEKEGIDNIVRIESELILEMIAFLREKYGGVNEYMNAVMHYTAKDLDVIKTNLTNSVA